jgi:FdhE protein
VTLEGWLKAHPYLQPFASLSSWIGDAVAEIPITHPGIPRWEDYAKDFDAGVPLLRSVETGVDLEPVGGVSAALAERLAAHSPAGRQAAEASLLCEQLRRESEPSRRVADWLLGDQSFAPSAPGLLRYLGWTAAARYLMPLVDAFDRWRGEDRWLRRYCPTCGSAPAMAQLIVDDQSRKRLLCCGCCRTRWQYRRTACPFCENDPLRLSVVAIEGEGGLRIDYCESCKGFLKTYVGQGDEGVLLSDWTSIHLDLVAQDRGLKRLAASLYELEPGQ